LAAERRQYLRLDSVFPIEFQFLSLDGKQALSDWLQGFTNNIGKGGLCLEVNNLSPELVSLVNSKQSRLSLEIEMPVFANPVKAQAEIAWTKDIAGHPHKYLLGLRYVDIDAIENQKILHYAWAKKLFLPAVMTIFLILGLGFVLNSYLNVKLIRGNKALVEQLVKIVQESSVAKQKIKQVSRDRDDLLLKMQALALRIQTVEEEKAKNKEVTDKISALNALIEKLSKEKEALNQQFISVQQKESIITEELLSLDKRRGMLQKANMDKLYQWLAIHQNPRTGLVMSFEGDPDFANWAFIYDQSLVAQTYIYFADFERARKILDFFDKKAKRLNGMFFNAYYSSDGTPAEYIVHSGPNIWLGIAVMQYYQKTQDQRYLPLALDIGSQIMNLQNQDADAGIRGGPNVQWYSTEHNLDAYAFFNMLYKVTGKTEYLEARDKTFKWLMRHTYDRAEAPIKRGKGDATIATDTYAWSIAALGPDKLAESGMNPDKIIEFAEQNCMAEVCYLRPEGKEIRVKGFDFAPQKHIARGKVVSSEWTAQMVLAFKLVADFYYKKNMIAKARAYELKADEYLSQLCGMIISSSSPSGQGEGCLPYATQEYVDTGHGWMTPKGRSTGSVAGTAYTLFAYYKYNPLDLK